MKKRNLKNNLRYILIGITGVLPLAAIPFLGLFPHNNNVAVNTINTKALKTDISVSPYNNDEAATAKPEFQNAIYQDAFEKATYDPDSILVYSIYWFGVFHRFGLVSHILSVLDINPNQKIYVMETSKKNDYSTLLALKPDGTRKYPNVKIVESAPGFDSTDGVWLLSNRFITPIDFFKDIYKENPNARIHGYFADFTILEVIKNFFNGSNLPILKKNIHDYWGMFNKFESLSIFADRTSSVDFFDTTFYNYLLKAGIGEYTKMASNKSEYKEAANFRKQFLESQKKGEDFTHKFLEKNNAIMYIASLITTKDFNNDNEYPVKDATNMPVQYKDSKFFLPTTEFIRAVNRKGSTFLKTSNDEFFNPYNSYEADLIESFKRLPKDKFDELTEILKAKAVIEDQILTDSMKNKINVVYSGTLLNNDGVSPSVQQTTRKSEIDNLRAIKVLVEKEDPVANKGKVQIIYKGHPRDKTAEAIKAAFAQTIDDNKITDITVDEIKVVDPAIPYELYLFSGLFDSDPAFNKVVKLYSSYSTIIWFLFADGRSDDIIKIAINEDTQFNSKYIENIYGLDSRIFNKLGDSGNNKLTTTQKLLDEAGIK